MVKYSDAVENDIKKRSKIFGLVLGILCLPFAFVAGSLGGCCPLGSFLGVLPVALTGGLAGTLAAMFLDWGQISSQDALGVGVKVGLRTSLIASAIGAVATFIVSLLSAGAIGAVGQSAQPHSGASGAAYTGASALLNFFVLALAVIPGVLLGVLGGVIGAAIKRPAAGPK